MSDRIIPTILEKEQRFPGIGHHPLFGLWCLALELVCNAGDLGLIPGLERSTGEGNGNSLQYSCLENPMDRRPWQATVHRVAKVRHNLATKLLRRLLVLICSYECYWLSRSSQVDLAAILDPFDSTQYILCPQAVSVFQRLCPAPSLLFHNRFKNTFLLKTRKDVRGGWSQLWEATRKVQ